jgi:hypothetical protein
MSTVQALRDLAAKTVREGTELWLNEPEMLSMVWQDANSYRRLATLLERGDVEAAQRLLDSLDTAPREYACETIEASLG